MKMIIRPALAALFASLAPAAFAASLGAERIIADGTTPAQFPSVAYYNNVIHVVYVGFSAGSNGDIFYTRSTNGGTTFSPAVNLSNSAEVDDRPQVTAGPNGVVVAWNSSQDNGAVYSRRSADGGANFSPRVTVADSGGGFYSRITGLFTDSGGRVHVVYYDNGYTGGASGQVRHRMSCDGGQSYSTDSAVTSQAVDGDYDNEQPRITEAGGRYFIVFRTSRLGDPQGGWPPYAISMQSGTLSGCAVNWTYPARRLAGGLPLDFNGAYGADIVADATGNLLLAYWSMANGANVYLRKGAASSLFGAPMKLSNFNLDHLEPGGLASTPGQARGGFLTPPGLATNGTNAYVAYQQQSAFKGDGYEHGQIFLRESTNNGTSFGAELPISSSGQATTPRIALGGAGLAIVYSDISTNSSRILFRMYGDNQVDPYTANLTSVITGYYQTILGRSPDQAGLDYWISEAGRVTSLGADVREAFFAMAVQFFNTPEYLNRNTNNTQYLTDLYRTFFLREPDQAGLDFWMGYLNGGMDRGALLTNFLFSTEFSNKMTGLFGSPTIRPEINMVIDLYRGILGVLPDSAGFNFWLGQVRQAQCQGGDAVSSRVRSIADGFVGSAEYANREAARPAGMRNGFHVGDLYNAFLRRGADPPGYSFWVGQLNGGRPRDDVRLQYIQSTEFQNRVAQVIMAGCAL